MLTYAGAFQLVYVFLMPAALRGLRSPLLRAATHFAVMAVIVPEVALLLLPIMDRLGSHAVGRTTS